MFERSELARMNRAIFVQLTMVIIVAGSAFSTTAAFPTVIPTPRELVTDHVEPLLKELDPIFDEVDWALEQAEGIVKSFPDQITALAASSGFTYIDGVGNDDCSSAVRWPVTTVGRGVGTIGGDEGGRRDVEDWSAIELYRTEVLTATSNGPESTFALADPGCGTMAGTVVEGAAENGWYGIQISGAEAAESPYTIEWSIAQNDADTRQDISDVASGAFPIPAMPESLDPRENVRYSGALPNRKDLGPADSDWFRITLQALPDLPDGVSAGVLMVEFNADCNDGYYWLRLYQLDQVTEIAHATGCGGVQLFCMAIGVSAVLAELKVDSGTGTGYNLSATIAPIKLGNLTPLPELESMIPPCDPLTRSFLNPS